MGESRTGYMVLSLYFSVTLRACITKLRSGRAPVHRFIPSLSFSFAILAVCPSHLLNQNSLQWIRGGNVTQHEIFLGSDRLFDSPKGIS